MPLPVGQLSRASFDYRGTAIPIQSLTRAQTFHIREIQADLNEVEVFVLMCGTGSSREEVEAFRQSEGDSALINQLVVAIGNLSGIKIEVTENEADPKAS